MTMTAGDPTPREVDRALQQFREDIREDLREVSRSMRDGFASLNSRLDKVPSMDVYNADKIHAAEREAALRERVKLLEGKRETDARQRTIDRRWVIGAVILPVAVALAEVWVTAGGPH